MTAMTIDSPAPPTPAPARRVRGELVIVSLLVHLALFAALGGERRQRARPPKAAEVTVTVAPRPAPPPPPAPPAPVAAPRTTPLRAPRPVARAARPAPAPTEAPPPPRAEPEPIADLTGVTLTNDGPGVGWSSAVGDGSASAGPIGPPRRTAPAAATGTGSGSSGPPVVALADLRHRPEPPDLDQALARSYPEDARRAGLTGSATVRATIHPDGTVGTIRGVTASAPTFADACRRTLSGSHWTPPVDRNGRPCATEIRYTCHFELGQ